MDTKDADTAGPQRIRLSDDAFHQLAAGRGGPEVIRRLQEGQRSRRLVMLRALLEAATGAPAAAGPLPAVREAWDALEAVQRSSPGAVDAVLAHPQIGSWLSHALRRHHRGDDTGAPAWTDFGQLNALVLATAAIAGLDHRTVVPLRDGSVLIPRFGMAVFDGCERWDTAEAWVEDGRIRLRHGGTTVEVPHSGDAAGWMALRTATARAGDLTLAVYVDDLDPWRDLAEPVRPARLGEHEFGAWTRLLQDAWAILVSHHRPVAEALATGFTSLVPLPAGDGWDTRSASTGDAFGAIMCSPPPDPVTLAVSLAHEWRHIALGGLMHLVPLTEGPGEPCLYAPWRDDPRPAGGLLQGIYAFHGIAAFWRTQRLAPGGANPQLDDFEYAYSREQTREAIAIALADGNLTGRGRDFVHRMAATMDDWADDDLDPEAAELARLVADAHRAGWRIRHRRPSDRTVTALATAWQDRAAPAVAPAAGTVLPDPAMRHWSGPRLGLARRRLVAPEKYWQARDTSWGADLSEADLRLFAGEPDEAARGYRAELAGDPAADDAWTGLGLALQRTGDTRTGRVLLEHPDLVAALHHDLAGAADPVEIAGWLTAFREK
ncbi:HEXXH motif domain-containing protein [Actinoplanes couchii]|uniref:HEXXH motif domain-containing protein n=1 Tax=Actinoplanes couchii TaxID=403638 RepID=A0ABQ3X2F0_9ACTN|nr:HEXXH motif domain-containing protein [Actinoplanes couchii]MDR6322416.1 HEXXH motif-containing protein [Actinoplanes couchii]GID52649.1 HEXXH motif domain-containing protein [Actinoplanes couchii]